MVNIAEFISELGGLHDAKLTSLAWDPADQRLEIGVDDIYSNFEGLPEYEGPAKAAFIFSGVSKLNISVEDFQAAGLMIYDWNVQKDASGIISEMKFSPDGSIVAMSAAIECRRK
jgi:hypothetical protein